LLIKDAVSKRTEPENQTRPVLRFLSTGATPLAPATSIAPYYLVEIKAEWVISEKPGSSPGWRSLLCLPPFYIDLTIKTAFPLSWHYFCFSKSTSVPHTTRWEEETMELTVIEQTMKESICALSNEADQAFSSGDQEKGLQVYREIERMLLCHWILQEK
jgi:hypothetical protein